LLFVAPEMSFGSPLAAAPDETQKHRA
jgi:hypothetical protein